jgi:hypothetical protein
VVIVSILNIPLSQLGRVTPTIKLGDCSVTPQKFVLRQPDFIFYSTEHVHTYIKYVSLQAGKFKEM